MTPRTTGQGVGGSSSTGAKLADSTCRGSTDGRSTGGSTNVLIASSSALQNAACSEVEGRRRGLDDRGACRSAADALLALAVATLVPVALFTDLSTRCSSVSCCSTGLGGEVSTVAVAAADGGGGDVLFFLL
ncbi:hypothetical protein ZWY2020_021864 [Hordeum vulgare]|nr:hypothetical protein ZWY2020_021864 [Hordeum vulgare]